MAGKKRASSPTHKKEKPPKQKPQPVDDIENELLEPEEKETEQSQKVIDILSSSDLPDGASNELKDLLASSELLEAGYTATLYKFDNEYSGTQKSMVAQWYENILSEHEIGLKFGSGRYMVIVRATDKQGLRKVKGITFRIHKHYDDLRNEQKSVSDNPLLAAAMANKGGGDGTGNIILVMGIMEKMIKVFSPLINQQNASPVNSNMNEMLVQNYKNTSDILKEAMIDNLQLINDIQRNQANVSEVYEDEDEVTGMQGFIKTFAPLLEKFIPLITGKGQHSKQMIDTLQSTKQYKNITKNKKNLIEVVKYLEGKHGKDKTDKLLKKLNLIRPH